MKNHLSKNKEILGKPLRSFSDREGFISNHRGFCKPQRFFLDLEGLIFQNTTSTNPQILEILIDYLLPEGDFFQTH